MRMLMNNLDPEVAEKPAELIVYGGSGKAARNWKAYGLLIKCLRNLEKDETLLVQSGKPVGIFKTNKNAPRVLISNAMLVPNWGNWEKFRELEDLGLTMYGQMTAGSWIYIGTQGILQGTYEAFAAAAKKHFGGTLKGRLVLSAGLGGMGGAQPLAVTMNEGVFLGVDVDPARIKRRLKTGYLDVIVDNLEDALILSLSAKEKWVPLGSGFGYLDFCEDCDMMALWHVNQGFIFLVRYTMLCCAGTGGRRFFSARRTVPDSFSWFKRGSNVMGTRSMLSV